MVKFEVGKKYTHGWIGDHDLKTTWEVVKRTACTVTIKEDDCIRTCRIDKYLTEKYGNEHIYPYGKYSKCPILQAV